MIGICSLELKPYFCVKECKPLNVIFWYQYLWEELLGLLDSRDNVTRFNSFRYETSSVIEHIDPRASHNHHVVENIF